MLPTQYIPANWTETNYRYNSYTYKIDIATRIYNFYAYTVLSTLLDILVAFGFGIYV